MARLILNEDHPGEILEIHLVDDARGWWDAPAAVKSLLPPAQEDVSLTVALEFELGVAAQGFGCGEEVDLDGVVDDQIHRDPGVDPPRITAEASERGPHRRQVDNRGNAGEILHEDTRREEGDLRPALGLGGPAGQGLDVMQSD